MFKYINNLINTSTNFYWLIWIRQTLSTAPLFETFFGLGLILIRLLFNECMNMEYYFKYETPFYDTGSMISFLICLEHIYVCYYLIIIIIMVYWFLYLCIVDFSGWSFKNKGLLFVIYNYIFKINNYLLFIYIIINKYIYNYIYLLNEINYLYFNINRIINYNTTKYYNLLNNKDNNLINLTNNFDLLGRSFTLFNTEVIKYWKNINLINELNILFNKELSFVNNLYLQKSFTKYLYYTIPKSYFFFLPSFNIITLKNPSNSNVILNSIIINLRSLYKDIFITNNFKHSGIFEAIWAIFPTIIIICILIPSLILLYSFEDILNPKISVKVIGNQWYWTYEFDNWIQYKQLNSNDIFNTNKFNINNFLLIKNNLNNYSKTIITQSNNIWSDFYLVKKLIKDSIWLTITHWYLEWNIYYYNYEFINFENVIEDPYDLYDIYLKEYSYIINKKEFFFNHIYKFNSLLNKNIYTNYAFNSVILFQDNLIYGTKRLLECDNRLVLPTNLTIRFLVTSADVLHAFAMPELGFKVDAVPGRLNQILIFINRPGIFYGQCSELCGANHAFMPIVIQSVLPNTYLLYIENIQLKTDLIN